MVADPRWLGPLTGIGAMVLTFVGGSLEPSSELSPGSAAETIARELYDSRSATRAFVYVAGLGAVLFFVFVAYLYTRLRAEDPAGRWLSTSIAVSGAAAGATFLVFLGLNIAASGSTSLESDPGVAKT